MHVLVIKMSSMGDVIHTLPAVTDAQTYLPDVRFDWVVEDSLAAIPSWHPAVDVVIPVSLRRWRRRPGQWLGREIRNATQSLRRRRYDCVIDAQGLLKSAAISRLTKGTRAGYASDSAREPLASLAYTRGISVDSRLHAIERTRALFAGALGYQRPEAPPDYGRLTLDAALASDFSRPYVVFNHASTWESKLWPENYWRRLVGLAADRGCLVLLPWGNDAERERAIRLSEGQPRARLLPAMGLEQLAAVLAGASAVVSVDTGLGHLAAAVGAPAVSIYGATDPALTGTRGRLQQHVTAEFECSPCLRRVCSYNGNSEVRPACYATVLPDQVWGKLFTHVIQEQQ